MSGRNPDQRIGRPVALQTWTDLTFLHWRVEPPLIQALLPAGLQVDVLDGSAWLGVVPFRMADVRLPGLPPVPVWSRFPELNVRTYVRGPDGHDGVWFLGLLCPRRAFIVAVDAMAGLRYRRAEGRVTRNGSVLSYGFRLPEHRRGQPTFVARVEAGSGLGAGERGRLADALTGRWNAYTERSGRLIRVPVEHEPWPLYAASARVWTWPRAIVDIPRPEGEPIAHFSPMVHARIGAPVRVRRG